MRLAPVVYPGKMFWDTAVIKPVWGHPLPDESPHRLPSCHKNLLGTGRRFPDGSETELGFREEQALILTFEIRSKDLLTQCLTQFLLRPETSAIGLFTGTNVSIKHHSEGEYQFPLARRLEYVMPQWFHLQRRDINTQFLGSLTHQGLMNILTQVHVSAYCCIPFAWLDILPCRTLLQEEVSLGIEHMQMHYRV